MGALNTHEHAETCSQIRPPSPRQVVSGQEEPPNQMQEEPEERPDPGVRVSEAVRERLERSSSSVIEVKPMTMEDESLQVEDEADMCKRLYAQDQRWLHRLQCIRARYYHKRGICHDNAEILLDRVEEMQIPINGTNPCEKGAEAVLQCYLNHKDDTLKCREVVRRYMNRVDDETRIRVRKLGRQSAVAKLSALDCATIRSMNDSPEEFQCKESSPPPSSNRTDAS